MSDVLARFHRTLVEEIRAKRPDYIKGPFTVAEIYQNLVPYGSHRDRIGVEMNADYEDALLRLLAGEGGFLVLESEPALRDLREELESSNPNTGLYREFAAVDVRLNQGMVDQMAPAGASYAGPPRAEPDTMSVDDLAPRDADAVDEDSPTQMSLDEPAEAPTVVASSEPSTACRWCRAPLPHRDNLNFCPFCGTDVHVVPCPACGEELEPDWRFCFSCGTEVAG